MDAIAEPNPNRVAHAVVYAFTEPNTYCQRDANRITESDSDPEPEHHTDADRVINTEFDRNG